MFRFCAVVLLLFSSAAHAADDAPDDAPTLIFIHNVAVWDGMSDAATPGQDVLIEGALIAAIGAGLEAPEGATLIEGGGRVLIPGIIDAHSHLALAVPQTDGVMNDPAYEAAVSVAVARKMLMRGWTTMRDMGGPIQGLARAIDEGFVPGPRIFPSAAFITQTSGHGDMRGLMDPHPNMGAGVTDGMTDRHYLIADGETEVRRATREVLRQGASQVKLMAGGGISSTYDPLDTVQYSEAELRAAVEAAADWHTYVAVHAYTDEAVNRAIDAGVKVIEHGHLLSEKTLRRMKKEGVYLSSQSFGFTPDMAHDLATDRGRKTALVMSGVDNMMFTAKKIGLPVNFGTDSFWSMEDYESGVEEFTFRKRWFTSVEILRQATGHNARLLALTGPRNPYGEIPIGVIKEGAYADLLIVEGNPLEDVSILEDFENTLKLIMKNGVVYKDTL